MVCKICNCDNFEYDGDISKKCKNCNILYNLNTTLVDYSDGGGQSIPSKKKSTIRVKNALQRFKIIKPYLINHNIFVDIGCGSGEMLEASKSYFQFHVGYDENEILINYARKKGLNVHKKYFERNDIKKNNINGLVVGISHVIEHVDDPLNMLKSILKELRSGDLLYIEVPLYTGYSFKRKKYKWSLWNNEHLALYSMKTLKILARELNLSILDYNYRNYYIDNFRKNRIIKLFIKNPIKFLKQNYQKKSYQLILDNQMRDYGFILCKVS